MVDVGIDKVDLDAVKGDDDASRNDGDADIRNDPIGVILRRSAVDEEAARNK